MKIRLEECYRLLKSNGTLWLHCDHRANHDLKTICHEIFGRENFINEIVWKRHPSIANVAKKRFTQQQDTLFWYKKSEDYTFNASYIQTEVSKNRYDKIEPETVRKYTTQPMLRKTTYKGNYNTELVFPERGLVKAPKNFAYAWSQETLDQKLEKNPYLIYWSKNGKPRYKKYLSSFKGVPVGSMWTDIRGLSSNDSERCGYSTQKPQQLLERIIHTSTNDAYASNEKAFILDPFCGSGTTLVAAKQLNRNYLGIDLNPQAVEKTKKRLQKINTLNQYL